LEDIFDEKKIRAELKRLDDFTGLKGATLPIKFGKAKTSLAYFSPAKDNMHFYFSNFYFQDPEFPVEDKNDVIRHEYAHYMDYVINGVCGHGVTWKMCCNRIGARPIRCYNIKNSDRYLKLHEAEDRENAELDKIKVGTPLTHPMYGKGTIISITGEGTSRLAVVIFPDAEKTKYLSLSWVHSNLLI